MWTRFSESARKTVYYAQELARRSGRSEVEPVDFVRAFVLTDEGEAVEDTAAGRILDSLGVPVDALLAAFQSPSGGDGRAMDVHDMCLSHRAKRLIEVAYQYSRELGDRYVGTEHLFLAALDDPTLREPWSALGPGSAGAAEKLREMRSECPVSWWRVWEQARLEP
jgi:ATP-dependent Clp protease ATP-binding subunit ClpC